MEAANVLTNNYSILKRDTWSSKNCNYTFYHLRDQMSTANFFLFQYSVISKTLRDEMNDFLLCWGKNILNNRILWVN